MLGYVRCATEELRVKHHSLYQAMYCGLCNSIGKNASKALLPFLSYDFVFLAFIRITATNEKVEFEKQFCLFHPFKNRKKRARDNNALRYASQTALFLTYEKMLDDKLDRDSSFSRRLLVSFFAPFLNRACKKVIKRDPALAPLYSSVSEAMQRGRELEKKDASLDEMCSCFASCLSAIFSFGTEGEEQRILASIGEHLGRFIYTLDAVDDLEQDEKKGCFNPILRRYGSAEKAKDAFPELDMVLSYYISQMKLAFDLLEGDPAPTAVCENIICLGLSRAAGNIMKPKVEKSK
ncbi:MAG: hypothetical protein E7580_07040 [Ruminococcaceae bacterium]|nr:hypothetical protein [Oscillospiraceae bacterium]